MPTDTQQQSSATIPQERELGSGEGVRNAEVQSSVSPGSSQTTTPPAQETKVEGEVSKELDFVNRATGRNYKSAEDAERGLRETVGYVGSLGQKASLVEKLVDRISREEGVTKEAALRYVEDLAGSQATNNLQPPPAPTKVEPTLPKSEASAQDHQLQVFQEQLWEEKLLRRFPEAEAKLGTVKAISQATGKDFVKAYEEDVLPLINEGKKAAYQTQDSKGGTTVLVSDKAGPQAPSYAETLEGYKRGQVSTFDMLKAKGLSIVARE